MFALMPDRDELCGHKLRDTHCKSYSMAATRPCNANRIEHAGKHQNMQASEHTRLLEVKNKNKKEKGKTIGKEEGNRTAWPNDPTIVSYSHTVPGIIFIIIWRWCYDVSYEHERYVAFRWLFSLFILGRMGKKPHFHVFSYASCVDLTQLLSQPNASWCTLRIPLKW